MVLIRAQTPINKTPSCIGQAWAGYLRAPPGRQPRAVWPLHEIANANTNYVYVERKQQWVGRKPYIAQDGMKEVFSAKNSID